MKPLGDTGGLPRVDAYLARLPAGVASHPGCLAKASLLRSAVADRPLTRDDVAALPWPVGEMVTCPPLDGEWVPDVWLVCALFAIAERYGMSDEEYCAWIRRLNTRMFTTTFRHLMAAATPDEIVRAAAERWAVFHRGSTLAVEDASPRRCTVRLSFPRYLFHGLALRQFAPAFEASLVLSDPTAAVDLVGDDETTGRFAATWRG